MAIKSGGLGGILGMGRKRGSGIQGGIEHLLPGRITGWAMAKGSELQEVRLLVGSHLIARAEINQPRPDVCDQLGMQGQPGFSLTLPAELPPLDWNQPVRLLALTADATNQAELQLIGQKKQTADRLRALFQSEQLGLEGHFDGLQQGVLQGWAARRGQRQPAQIWLQAEGLPPQPLPCDQWRGGMEALGLSNQCGFRLNPGQLPGGWSGRRVWCSFDPGGQLRLPQVEEVLVPAGSSVGQLTVPAAIGEVMPLKLGSYQEQFDFAPEDLREHWQALEQFRLFLDGFEEEINSFERLSLSKEASPGRLGWLGRLLGRC